MDSASAKLLVTPNKGYPTASPSFETAQGALIGDFETGLALGAQPRVTTFKARACLKSPVIHLVRLILN